MPTKSAQISNAQFNPDVLLTQIFEDTFEDVFLKVAIFEGITGSATLHFEKNGWTANLIEPPTAMAPKIHSCRLDHFLFVAANPHDGSARFFSNRNDATVSSVPKAQTPREGSNSPSSEPDIWISLPIRTLDCFLREAGVASLDVAIKHTKGLEPTDLEEWDIECWQPQVVILDDNSRGLDFPVRLHMLARGYACFHRTRINDWFAHREDAALVRPSSLLRRTPSRSWKRLRPFIQDGIPAFLRSFGLHHLPLGA